MTANTLLARMAARGVRVGLDGDNLKIDAPSGMLTDEDRHLLKCYKPELLWRLRYPDGDPGASGYRARVFIGGEMVRIPLDQLIAEGKAIIGDSTPGLDPDLWAASVALGRYDQAHREWLEANEDDHMREIRRQAAENVRKRNTGNISRANWRVTRAALSWEETRATLRPQGDHGAEIAAMLFDDELEMNE